MNRDEFLARVRDAAAAGRSYRIHAKPLPHSAGRADEATDVLDRFVREAGNNGGRVVRCENWQQARDAIRQLFHQYEPRSALCWRHPTLDRLQLASLLNDGGIERIDAETLAGLSRESQRTKMLSADVGITSCSWAVAETGSLLHAHGLANERTASLAPPVYFAVVERSQIVHDLFDAVHELGAKGPAEMPSNATFISGPSKTGDIETKLVTGVHGPGKWHVIVVDA